MSQLSLGATADPVMRDPQCTHILLLSHESPWPAQSGAALRTLGLLRELRKAFEVELVLLMRQPLSDEQSTFLGTLAHSVTCLPSRDVSGADKLRTLPRIARLRYPYHSAVLDMSLAHYPEIRRKIAEFQGIVFTSTGHWGTLVHDRPAPNWILNQCDADVQFWRVYASQVSHPLVRLVAHINYWLARSHYPSIYANVGRIISVCDEDRLHTLALAPRAQVEVIENGVDCSYYYPLRRPHNSPRLLFTGTSAMRNVTALQGFVRDVFPLIRSQLPEIELLVGGAFSSEAQALFRSYANIRFTGRVDDIRPVFHQSDIFIAPFADTHGSKLKIAEAMAMGMPIVSTPMGIRGFPLVDNASVLLASSPQQFADRVIALLANKSQQVALGSAARELALSRLDWCVLGRRLRNIVETTHDLVRR